MRVICLLWRGALAAGSASLEMEIKFGGAEEARTPDLQSAILALSQLSYCPVITNSQRARLR